MATTKHLTKYFTHEKTSFIYLLLLIALGLSSCQQEKTFKGSSIQHLAGRRCRKGGFDAIADEIVRSNADFVTLSEVRNYHQTRFATGSWKRCSKEDKRTILSTPRIPAC